MSDTENFKMFDTNPEEQLNTEQAPPMPQVETMVPKPAPNVSAVPVQKPVHKTVDYSKNTTEQNLNMLTNKEDYSIAEWEERLKIYVVECNRISIDPISLNVSTMAETAYRIDNLLTRARFDNIYIQSKLNYYDNQIKLKEKSFYDIVYRQLTSSGGKAPTVDVIKSVIVNNIQGDKSFNGHNLYEQAEKYAKMAIGSKGIIDSLQDKQQLLITYSAMLKVESSLENFQPRVPNDKQMKGAKK